MMIYNLCLSFRARHGIQIYLCHPGLACLAIALAKAESGIQTQNLDPDFRRDDNNENMENLQPAPPQKTSFWDFKNKKIYNNKQEKIIDLITGFFASYIFGVVIFPFLLGIFSYFGLFFGDNLIRSFFQSELALSLFIFLPHIPFLIYFVTRRRYVFYGWLIDIGWMAFTIVRVLVFELDI